MILLLFVFGWWVFGSSNWFGHTGRRGYLLLFVCGALLAIGVEWLAVHELQRWTYTDAMPRFPVLDIGVIPVLQMILLPPIVSCVGAKLAR